MTKQVSSAARIGRLNRLAARVARLIHHLQWGIADQCLSSITNFGVNIVIIRLLGMPAFGAFALAFTAYTMALNISRGLATDPLVIRYSGAEPVEWRRATAESTGTALCVGTLGGLAGVVAGTLLGPFVGPHLSVALVALGAALPGLLLQDAWRYAFFAGGRDVQAFLNDLVWTITQLVAFGLVIGSGETGVGSLALAWGGAASVAALAGVVQAGTWPHPQLSWQWIHRHWDLSSRYVAENLGVSGENQVRSYGTWAIAGLDVVGSLRAANILLGPLNVVQFAVELVALPNAVRAMQRSIQRLMIISLIVGAGLFGVTMLWAGALLLLPNHLGTMVMGSSWLAARALLIPMALWTGIVAFATGARVGLRALAAARRSLRTRLLTSALWTTGGLTGVAAAGAIGSAWGLAGSSVISTALWWWQFRRALRERDPGLTGSSS